MIAVAFCAAALAATAGSDLEAKAGRHVLEEYERVGRSAPVSDPKLTAAARAVAKEAVNTSAADAADPIALTEWVSSAGGADPVLSCAPLGSPLGVAFPRPVVYSTR